MSDHLTDYDLHSFLAEDMSADEAASLRNHLDSCSDCRYRSEKLVRKHEQIINRVKRAGGQIVAQDLVAIEESGKRAPENAFQTSDHIGQFKILSVLGEGGFGVVYLAEQTKPIKRQVALKVIKPGMDSKAVIARFEAERQALAMMNHPNVAKVFDAGTTELGQPYFVMELVTGVSITDHCDRHKLDIKERLNLFIEVCEAIQHAHQKGIIHRDIKPSNILVEYCNDKSVCKVIDFGVAKAIEQRLTEQTIFTQQGQIIGTPAYMSPEQAEMTAQDIDTRSDIYSLGIVLYQLLTGVTPFETKTLLQAGWDEIRRVIREEEPQKPSTKLSSIGSEEHADSTTIARNRKTNPGSLSNHLRGDLDWVTIKALEKDRVRRYATATELADDIRRHLRDEPVLASPPSSGYKFKKFIRRNKGQVAAVAALLVTFMAGLALVVHFNIKAEQARAERLLQLIKADLAQAETLVQQVKADHARAETLVQQVKADHARAETARAQIKNAISLTDAGEWIKAEEQYRKILELNPNSAKAYTDLARMRIYHHNSLHNPKSNQLLEQAVRDCRHAIEIERDNITAWNTLGVALKKLSKYEEALEAYGWILKRQPEAYFALVNQGTLLIVLRRLNLSESYKILLKSTKVDQHCPYSVDTWRNLGSLQLHLGEKQNGLSSLQHASNCNPDDVGTKLLEARYVMEEDIERAAEALAIAKHESRNRINPRLHRLYAQLALLQGNFGKAESHAQKAINTGDLKVINYLIIAVAQVKLKRFEDALRSKKRANDAWPPELRESDGYQVTAYEGVLWFDTADEITKLMSEAELLLDASDNE